MSGRPSNNAALNEAASNKAPRAGGRTPYRMSPENRRVFGGLMLGMFVSSISQTIVGPGMPRIVADLGGMDHYSWVATSAMLVSAVTVPIAGKLSDLYGRKRFYLGGLTIFMIGAVICGLAPNFWTLVAGRAVQGLGMGVLMPLSQTIIGDIVPPRARGKYQGLMGAVFGVTSVAGPLAGGFLTDHFGWRWLFFAALPLGVLALIVIARFMHLPHARREARIDKAGIATLTLALLAILYATSSGGTTYAWSDPLIVGLFAFGGLMLTAFLVIETRAQEPVLPLRLFRDPVIRWSNLASFGLAMVMFATIIYIPVHAQGVLGVSATNSGLILMPMMLALVGLGILVGLLVTRTGHYKPFMLGGLLVMAVGVWLLTRLTVDSSPQEMTIAMTVLGIGLGASMQLYTLVVQNAVTRRDMGVATASNQFFRNVGSTVGIAVAGSLMTSGQTEAILRHLPEDLRGPVAATMGEGVTGAALDPASMPDVPPVVLEAVRAGMADQLHLVFLACLPILAVTFLLTVLIPNRPLRTTLGSLERDQSEPTGAAPTAAPTGAAPTAAPTGAAPTAAPTPRRAPAYSRRMTTNDPFETPVPADEPVPEYVDEQPTSVDASEVEQGETIGASSPNEDSTRKDPENWVTGDEPMTGAQRSYLDTLARQAGETLPADLTKAEASEHIDRLQKLTGPGISH